MITTYKKKVLAVLGVFALLPIFFIPLHRDQPAYANTFSSKENRGATVKASVLNVRENPSLSSKVVGRLNMGARITIQEEQSGWAKMESSSGIQGWVYEYYIAKDEPGEMQPVVQDPAETGKTEQTQSIESNSAIRSTAPSIAQNSKEPLKGKTIVLDPGHGGKDDGTTSIVGTHEKSLILQTTYAVKQKLENKGARVMMTRTDDTFVPLLQRAQLSNQNHADAFISFHYNWSSNPSANGITNFYYRQSDIRLASDLINEVVKTTGLNKFGIKFGDLCVLRNNSQPSTLIELGFLSNEQDDLVVESSAYSDKVANGVYRGLLDYFSR